MVDRQRLLVVDDDADMRLTIILLFERSYEVLEADNGEDAVRLAAEKMPRIILLDVSMPGMSGIETLKAVHAVHPAQTVIMLTAQTDIALAREALDLGADSYVTKPFEPAALVSTVARLMSGPRPRRDQGGQPWRIVPLSRRFYAMAEKKGVYTRKRGLDRATNKELLLKHIRENAAEGSRLRDLLQVLPGLTRRQVQNLLEETRKEGLAYCTGKTRATLWFPGSGK